MYVCKIKIYWGKVVEEAKKINISLEYEDVRTDIYGMEYSEWKKKYQTPIKK